MSEEKGQREHHIPIWGIFLLFLGIVFLLQSLDVLPWGLWGTLWHFWPVLVIIIGLSILLRRYNVWLVSLLILALLFACLGIAIWHYEPSLPTGQTTKSYSEPLDGLKQAQIEIDFNTGNLIMTSLLPSSPNFVETESKVKSGNKGMRVDFSRQGSEGRFYLSREGADWPFWDKNEDKWQAMFSRNVPLTVDVKSAASNVVLDLSQLQVTKLQMDIDVGNYTVKMPSSAGTMYVYIKADLTNLEVIIPDAVAAKLKTNVDLAHTGVDESRFPRTGDYYMSRDFESAKNRIELELDGALSRVQVR